MVSGINEDVAYILLIYLHGVNREESKQDSVG